jgi:hypothetical protein
MNIVLWVITVLLALLFLMAGAMKIAQPKAKLAASGQGWVEDFSEGTVKRIGAAEILGALGLILPAVLNIATVLVPAAASGIFLLSRRSSERRHQHRPGHPGRRHRLCAVWSPQLLKPPGSETCPSWLAWTRSVPVSK